MTLSDPTGLRYDDMTGAQWNAYMQGASISTAMAPQPTMDPPSGDDSGGYSEWSSQYDPFTGEWACAGPCSGLHSDPGTDARALLIGMGMAPGVGEFFDAVDGFICATRNDWECVALTGASMIPFAGWGAGAKKIGNLADDANSAARLERVTAFDTRAEAGSALEGDLGVAANRFFRGATAKSQDFKIGELANGNRQFQFFSPARNEGFGKLYVQEVDPNGLVVREYKDTLGPDGLIERKWLSGNE